MSRLLAALALAATFAGAVHAEPTATQQTASMGQITPHGVFDAR